MYEYYQILQVGRNATQEEIKISYRRLSMTLHPDRGGSEDEFKKLNEAYSVLSNRKKRIEYDKFGTTGVNGDDERLKQSLINLIITLLEGNSENVLEDAERVVLANVSQKEQSVIELLNKKEKLENKIKKFKRTDKSEFLIRVVEGRINEIMNNVNMIRANIENDKKVIALIKDFSYDTVVPGPTYVRYTV